MVVTAVEARDFRSLVSLQVSIETGISSIVGRNGSGKTNLIEALYFGLTGRSFRTGERREMIRFGCNLGRARVNVRTEAAEHELLASVTRSEGRRHLLDGAAAGPETIAAYRPAVAVFSPDRLALVKGPPAERRAHLDQFVAVRWPARADLRRRFGQALAQRNAMLARIAAGAARVDDLDPWDASLAGASAPLIEARREASTELAARFGAAALELGLEDASLSYRPRASGSVEELTAGLLERRGGDIGRGRSGWGPHLDEIGLDCGERSLRRYGSQGEQRTALLALLFAEREQLLAATGNPPLLLLDDVMSELDPDHRDLLAERLSSAGQTIITAAEEAALPAPATASVIRMPFGEEQPLRAVA